MSNVGVEADLTELSSSANKTAKVIRYSREFLLECAKSPLVTRPKTLPPINVLFGEPRPQNSDSSTSSAHDAAEPSKEGTLKDVPHISTIGPMLASLMNKEGALGGPNGSLMRSADKNIILGPPKMSFASSQKHAFTSSAKGGEEGDRKSRTRLTGGDEQRNTKPFLNDLFASRAPRTPADREKGFSRDGGERSTRRAAGERNIPSREGTSQFNGTGKTSYGQNKDRTPVDGSFKTSARRRNQSPGHRVSNDNNPDWMDYDPTQEGAEKDTDAGKDRIQIWKQQMKEKGKELSGEPDSADKRSKTVSRADASSSWRVEKSEGAAIEHNDSHALLENPEKPSQEKNSSVDGSANEKPKQTQPINDNIDHLFGPSYNGTNQFEKFLRKSNEPSPIKTPTEPLTEESRFSRLFRKGATQGKEDIKPAISPADKTGGQMLMDMLNNNLPASSSQGSASLSTSLQPGKKVITEDELLRKLGAKVPQSPEKASETSNDFSFLMDKLTKGLGGTGISQNTPNMESHASDRPKASGLPNDPSIVATSRMRPSSPDGSAILAAFVKGSSVNVTSTVESAKHKPNLILDGNVPTSVYRQLSGRSEVVIARTLASSQNMASAQSAPPRPASPASHLSSQRSFPQEMYRQTMSQPPHPSPPLIQQQPVAPNMLTGSNMQQSGQRSMGGIQLQAPLPPQSRIDQFFGLTPPGPPQMHSQPPPPQIGPPPTATTQSYGFNHQQQRFPPPPPPTQLQHGTRFTPQQLALLHHHHQQQQQQQFHLHQQLAQPPPPSHHLQQHPQFFVPPHPAAYLGNDAMLSASMPGYGGFAPSLVQAAASLAGQQHPPQPQQYLTVDEFDARGFAGLAKRDGNDFRAPSY